MNNVLVEDGQRLESVTFEHIILEDTERGTANRGFQYPSYPQKQMGVQQVHTLPKTPVDAKKCPDPTVAKKPPQNQNHNGSHGNG